MKLNISQIPVPLYATLTQTIRKACQPHFSCLSVPVPLGSDFLSPRSKFLGIMPRLLGSPKALVRVFYKVKNNNTMTVCLFAPFSPQALKNFPKYYAINDIFPGLNLKT